MAYAKVLGWERRLEKKDQRAKERTVNEILGDSGQRF